MRIIIIGQAKLGPTSVKQPPRTTLDSLRRGQKAVITAVDPTDPAVQRLMVLGLVAGAEIEATGAAIGGDPLEFRLFGNGISLRREQARHFVIVAAGDGS
jgi:Fe2+ transport system protein FeoA